MLTDDELEEGQPRLLSTDNMLVVPVNKNIKMQITSDPAGVIHSWAVPSLGVKMDAIPGRLNETYYRIESLDSTMVNVQSYVVLVMVLCQYPSKQFLMMNLRLVEQAKEEFASTKDNKSLK